jgi:hypothetical protein
MPKRRAVAPTISRFRLGGSGWPCSISTGAKSAAKLVRLSLIRSQSFSTDADAGM